jgi:hypothetical protein
MVLSFMFAIVPETNNLHVVHHAAMFQQKWKKPIALLHFLNLFRIYLFQHAGEGNLKHSRVQQDRMRKSEV